VLNVDVKLVENKSFYLFISNLLQKLKQRTIQNRSLINTMFQERLLLYFYIKMLNYVLKRKTLISNLLLKEFFQRCKQTGDQVYLKIIKNRNNSVCFTQFKKLFN